MHSVCAMPCAFPMLIHRRKEEFEKAVAAGAIASAADDAYIKYADAPYRYYYGANDYDFCTNALRDSHGQGCHIAYHGMLYLVLSVAEYQRPSSLSHSLLSPTTISSVVR